MEQKKIKKLVLNKEIISNLTENGMSYIKGGNETQGTGYGMCICNGTAYCCGDSCGCGGANTSRGGCACA